MFERLFTATTLLAQATENTTDAVTAAPATGGPSGEMMFGIAVLVVIASFALGNLCAYLLKLKDLGFRMSVVTLALFFGLSPFVSRLATGDPSQTPSERLMGAFRLGIDLAGGTNLVYQVNRVEAEKMGKNVAASMDQMVGAIARRINPSGTEEVVVRRVGADRIEVIIPGADREVVEQKKRQMNRLGSLEFEILANERDHKNIIAAARSLPDDRTELIQGTRIAAKWRDVADTDKFTDHGEIATRTVKNRSGKEIKQVLVLVSPENRRVTGKYLTRAGQTFDQNGMLAVSFNFNQQGAFRFQKLTSDNQPLKDGFKRRLAILLDEKVHSAPNLNAVISDRGIIEGDFTAQEINELVNVLNAGALEVPLIPQPVSEFTITPTLGADVQQKGILAIAIAAVAVVIFMIVYYLVAGLIADLCLLLNIVLVLGVMSAVRATFTLPGLAGLVLTIGMAVDANVLIFERIREERARGSSLRMAIQNGFARAFTTIVDANVTTLIIAVVLYMIGTDQVRGFAVTLFIGIVMSMFASLYFGRLVFDILERKRMINDLKMLSIVGTTHWDFIGKRMICGALSLAMIVVGMGALASRGEENLDIDFSGGTMVTFEFVKPQEIDATRKFLQDKLGSSITLERLSKDDEEPSSGAGRRFRLRTTEQDIDKVRTQLVEAFHDSEHELRKVTVKDGWEVTQIPENEEAEGEGEKDAEAAKPAPAASPEYAGGNRVELQFNADGGVTTASISANLETVLEKKFGEKYPEPASLFAVHGTAGPGMTADEQSVRRFTGMEIETRPALETADFQAALTDMQDSMAETPMFEEVNTFDSSVASEMQQSAIMAMLASLVAIVAYIWFRFERITFGLAAVVALVHDVLVVLGLVAIASLAAGTPVGGILDLYDFKINLPMIAAFLTIVGYSLNDTIVVFDRIREVRGKNPALTVNMVNTSVNQTLARTLLTSFTTFIVVAILYAIGGEGIHGFAFCLVLGVIVGTYSSVYVASPVLLWLMNRPGSEVGRATAAAEARTAAIG